MKEFKSYSTQPKGEYTCLYCGTKLDHEKLGALPTCQSCGGGLFKKEH